MWSGAAQGLLALLTTMPAFCIASNSRLAAASFFPKSGARGLCSVCTDLVLDPVLRLQLAVAAGTDSSNFRKFPEQLLDLPVNLDVVDAVGRPGLVICRNEQVRLDLGEEPARVVLDQPVVSQKITTEDGLFHPRTNKLVGEQPPAQVNFSRGGSEGGDVVAAGAGKSDVGRPGTA